MKQTAIFTAIIGFLAGIIITFFAMHYFMVMGNNSHMNHGNLNEQDIYNIHNMGNISGNMEENEHAHHDTDDHWDMSMRDMSTMLEGLSGDMLDKMFLEGMIPHHQAAIDMAHYLESSEREELRNLGKEIIEVQQSEIEMMQNWLTEWNL
ncbi:DUF305 domain-containing protein [Candidatus Gracilibacteria bacterium]|nr:DUF305 domain-containing protein [Candidatus Gracilibacteria bacterium]